MSPAVMKVVWPYSLRGREGREQPTRGGNTSVEERKGDEASVKG